MDRSYNEKKELIPAAAVEASCARASKSMSLKLMGGVVVIKNVPALVCDLCDEAYLTPDVSRD